MQFWKYQGAGNDFIMLDQRRQQFLGRNDTARIAFLCDRHFGIGADGLILLQTHPVLDFEMTYFNADGRESTMCGNGGRCIAAFAKHLGMPGDKFRFWAIDGEHEALVSQPAGPGGEWVELKMSSVDRLENTETQDGIPEAGNAFILNTGSPHYVRFVPKVDGLDMRQEGRAIRYSSQFRTTGINVNFVEAIEDQIIIRTYERGVEDETLACGTGVTAAALADHRFHKRPAGRFETKVKALGGTLLVRFDAHENGTFSDIWLCGPAQQVFQGEIFH